MAEFLKHKLNVMDAKGFPGTGKQGDMNPASGGRSGKGGSVSDALVGKYGKQEMTCDAGKKGTGGKVDSKLWAMADSRDY